jgi:arginine decarboxylase
MRAWTIADSAELYGFSTWGRDFLSVADNGNVLVQPNGEGGPWCDLKKLVEDLDRRGIHAPVLLRFPDLLEARVNKLVDAFGKAFQEYDYKGAFRGVYPIKVNQQRHIVEDLIRFFGPHHMGLEAGSKPELLIVLALLSDPDALIICNGYKDNEYIETALMAQKLGRNPILVIEKPGEVEDIIAVASQWDTRPHLGIRSKLASRGSGLWESSAGDAAKFGLTVEEIVKAIDRLREVGLLDCVELLHFHIGSQVTDIRSFKNALKEAGRMYVELHAMGAPLKYFDVGGGLAVDYDGSQTNFHSSANYSVQEYAYDVVAAVHAACAEKEVPHPAIITESGRALVAHHAILVCEVLGVHLHPGDEEEDNGVELSDEDPDILRELSDVAKHVSRKNYQEAWHDALEGREEILNRFNLGLLDIRQRAKGENLFWRACHAINRITKGLTYIPDELGGLRRVLADTYFCNFSVFQSVPDSWAVGQLFPVAPIHRLKTKPTRRGILADLTCDSDGKIDKFIDLHDVKDALELHQLDPDKPYYIGVFLVGAYQEILGDMHNLFGDTNAVHVRLGQGQYTLEQVLEGDRVSDVLNYVQYDKKELIQRVRNACETALQNETITMEESAHLLKIFSESLEGYTYLERA